MKDFKSDWWSEPVLLWLSRLLEERFGHEFIISTDSISALKIRLVEDMSRCVELSLIPYTFNRNDSDIPCVDWDAELEGWDSVLDSAIPAPGAIDLPSPLIKSIDNGYRIEYDILGFIYWMLTRQEEIGRTDLDGYGCFPSTVSHAFSNGYLERPIVDEWLHILGQVFIRTWPSITLKKPNFRMRVSHDVDEPSRYGFRSLPGLVRAMAGDVLRRQDIKSAVFAPWIRMNSKQRLHPLDPYNTFDWIMDLSDRHGMRSSFYFICGRSVPAFDAAYEPEHPAIRSLMRHIHVRGHEVGLHPSYGTYKNPLMLKAEADRLRRVAAEEGIAQDEWGGRMHYLRWDTPMTMRGWVEAGMNYDSTLCYADRPGFRCGTCFEYQAFDSVRRESLPLRIRPLIVMECSVISKEYLGLGATETGLKKMMELKNACRMVGGCFTLLWHNSRFLDLAHKDIYQKMIA